MLRFALQRSISHRTTDKVASDDMKHQLTVRLPAHLATALDAAAKRMARKRSEVVRMALEEFLGPGADRETKPINRVRHLIGSVDSGVPDLAENHRRYLLETLRDGR